MLYRKPERKPAPFLNGHRRLIVQLSAKLACDEAFRVIARGYVGDVIANQKATCSGDPAAVHQMRIALTRLRTTILFFSPLLRDIQRPRIKRELKWLNAHLGFVRDFDVAIERLTTGPKQLPQATVAYHATLRQKRNEGHRLLARALRSGKYRRLIKSTSDWIENGPWSKDRSREATKLRARPIAEYSLSTWAPWQKRLLKKSHRLPTMSTRKRHRLRLLNKKLSYSIEAHDQLLSDKRFSKQQAALKCLRKAQKSLGQLNDDARGRQLASQLEPNGACGSIHVFNRKREKRLLRTAATAYRKLEELEK